MVFMLIDHIGATQGNTSIILRCIGRLAFPIYAFMIVEGFKHTSNVKKYMLRMLAFAILSEIPFNLMVSGGLYYPLHQNVLWTFLIGLICMYTINQTKKFKNQIIQIVLSLAITFLGYLAGIILLTDYNGCGVLMILVFYFFGEKNIFHKLIQLILMYYINVEMLSGLYFMFNVFGITINIYLQGLALFSLILIWLYNGEKGIKSKSFQYFCYTFYPLHMLILALI